LGRLAFALLYLCLRYHGLQYCGVREERQLGQFRLEFAQEIRRALRLRRRREDGALVALEDFMASIH
jgi:hypothetical protein